MRYAQIDGNNVAIGFSDLSGTVDAPNMILIGPTDDFTGWTFADGQWTAPAPAILTPTLAPLTRKKLRKALLAITVTAADVEAYIAAIPDEFEREDAMIDWQDSDEYHRDHPLIDLVASALQLPPEQVDTLWVWAGG